MRSLMFLIFFCKMVNCGYINFSDVPCGQSEPNYPGSKRNPKIVGGDMSYPGEFPFMVSIKKYHWNHHLCGGVLISKSLILTAAHCYRPEKSHEVPYYAVIGEFNIDNRDNPKEQILEVKKWVIHPSYQEMTKENDIALLVLHDNVTWVRKHAMPACIWDGKGINLEQEKIFATVAGWGKQNEGSEVPKTSDVLRKVKLEILEDYQNCQNVIDQIGLQVKLKSSHICAWWRDGGKDSCSGDSGGPMMIGQGNVKTVVGIVSTGKGCARKGYPGIYTRVSSYINFIRETAEEVERE